MLAVMAIILLGTVSAFAVGNGEADKRRTMTLQAEQMLSDLGYWIVKIDGASDDSTRQAILAFQKVEGLKRTGVLNDQVLEALRMFQDATNAELAASLTWPINRVTPRIKELRSKEFGELVFDNGKRKCRITGSMAHAWRAKHPLLPPPRDEKPKVVTNPQQLL